MELIINNDTVLEQVFEKIMHAYRVPALIEAIIALDTHRQLMAQLYGNAQLREWDTVKYLDLIESRMTSFDKAKQSKLSERRALLTTLCTEDEIDHAIEQAHKARKSV